MPTGFYPRKSAFDRILERVIFDPNDCWIWQGAVDSKGYGRIGVDNRVCSVHRVAFEILKGKIPEGMYLCHTCDVRSCCNPEHLFVGTQLDNMRDCVAKGRHKSGNIKLTYEQVKEIRELIRIGKSQYEVANKFGVTQSNISKIIANVSRRSS